MAETAGSGHTIRLRSTGPKMSPSAIIRTVERVADLKRRKVDIINLGLGESDLPTPDHVKAAVRAALDKTHEETSPPSGFFALREALCTWLATEYDLRFALDEVIFSTGSKLLLYQLFATTLDADDEVIIPTPAWPTIAQLVVSVGGRPVFIPTQAAQGFEPDLARVAQAITPRTRMIYLANPANPSGAVYSQATCEGLARLCAERGLVLVSDGAYRALYYEGTVPNVPRIAQTLGCACVLVDTLSKRYAMSAWRLGFVAGPKNLIAALTGMQGQTITCVPSLMQAAALAALSGPQDCVKAAVAEFARRRERMVSGLEAIPGFHFARRPAGSFFVFPDVTRLLGKKTPAGKVLETDEDLAQYFLEEGHVASMPGSPFGTPGHLRLSYTLELPLIEEGCRRLSKAVAALS